MASYIIPRSYLCISVFLTDFAIWLVRGSAPTIICRLITLRREARVVVILYRPILEVSPSPIPFPSLCYPKLEWYPGEKSLDHAIPASSSRTQIWKHAGLADRTRDQLAGSLRCGCGSHSEILYVFIVLQTEYEARNEAPKPPQPAPSCS